MYTLSLRQKMLISFDIAPTVKLELFYEFNQIAGRMANYYFCRSWLWYDDVVNCNLDLSLWTYWKCFARGFMVVDTCYVRIEMKAYEDILGILIVERLRETCRRSRNIHDAFRSSRSQVVYQRNTSLMENCETDCLFEYSPYDISRHDGCSALTPVSPLPFPHVPLCDSRTAHVCVY